MFVTNLKLAIRTLLKNRLQAIILIGGLSMGMATCILLLQYISFELSFDQFNHKKDQIYRVVNERFQNGTSVQKGTITYPTIGPTLKADYPEVKQYTRLSYNPDLYIRYDNELNKLNNGFAADEHFFEVFDYPLLAQDALQVLDETNEMVISKTIADQYFPAAKGNYNAVLGEGFYIDDHEDVFKVVGVFDDIPTNSHLQFDVLISYASFVRYVGAGANDSWTWSDFYHYLVLEDGTDVAAFEDKLVGFSEQYFRGAEVSGSDEVFTLQPLLAAHLYSQDLEYEIGETANGRAVWMMLIIAFFILLIAWINYVNLSSVKAIERSKEVGIRKVVGATRQQLMRQFFTEAAIVNTISLVFALGIVQLLSPWFAQNFEIAVEEFSFFQGHTLNTYLFLSLFALIVVGVLISGAYPAYLLSSTRISSVLKGIYAKKSGSATLRKSLVVFQFMISIALITATWMVSRQISYMSKQDLGFDINQVISINGPELSNFDSTFIDRINALKSELTKHPNIKAMSTSSREPGERMGRIFQAALVAEKSIDQHFTSNFINVDHSYADTYSLIPTAGRFFRREDHSNDFNQISSIVVTEEVARKNGMEPEEMVGQRLTFGGREKQWEVIGVVPDFHQRSLHHAIEPIILFPFYEPYNSLSVKVSGGDIGQTLAFIEQSYLSVFPGNIFIYQFVDEQFQRLYEADARFSNILSFFTALTILIACLGLFGLTSYMTFLRTKEIGIRKVLGASPWSIINLLSKDFLRLILVAFILAIPLAYLFLDNWLNNFAYKLPLEWWMFVIAGVAAILIAYLTIGFQSFRVAMTNPANSLRSE